MNDRRIAMEMIASAIKTEREACLFYRMLSELASPAGVRDKYLSLSADEASHADMLSALYAELSGGSAPPAVSSRPEGDPNLFDMGTASEEEALRCALRNELEAVAFYESQADFTEDPRTATILRMLADTEREHAQYLELQIDLLNDQP